MTDVDGGEEPIPRLDAIPSGCDCIWSIAVHDDGTQSGSIYIASERCQKSLMHPRTFREPPKETPCPT